MLRSFLCCIALISSPSLAEETELSNYVYPIITEENRDRFKFRNQNQTIYNRDSQQFESNQGDEWTARDVHPDVKTRTKLFREREAARE